MAVKYVTTNHSLAENHGTHIRASYHIMDSVEVEPPVAGAKLVSTAVMERSDGDVYLFATWEVEDAE